MLKGNIFEIPNIDWNNNLASHLVVCRTVSADSEESAETNVVFKQPDDEK